MTVITSAVDAGEVLRKAKAARRVLAAAAATTDKEGGPGANVLTAVREAGAFALTTPRRFGGLDAGNRTMVAVFSELGSACPSTSWLAQVSATAKSVFTPWMTPETQDALYADPNLVLCGSAIPLGRARAVPGGLRVSGRWPYASGCLDAPWAIVGIGASDDADVRLHPVVLPTSEFDIERTWDGVTGLRGTGSHTLVADDVFVPSAFQTDPSAESRGDSAPFEVRQLQVLLHIGSTLLGAAKGAAGVVGPLMTADRPVPTTTHQRKADSPVARQMFRQVHHLVATAETRLLAVADALDAASVSLLPVEAAQQRWNVVTAVLECRRAVETMLDLHGSSAFVAGNELLRFWQDLAIGSRHAALNPFATAEGYSRALFETADHGQAWFLPHRDV